jgi:hypothetical protein
VVFYVFNFVVIVGVGFLVLCLHHFVQEARLTHSRSQSQGVARPLEVLKSSRRGHRTSAHNRVFGGGLRAGTMFGLHKSSPRANR